MQSRKEDTNNLLLSVLRMQMGKEEEENSKNKPKEESKNVFKKKDFANYVDVGGRLGKSKERQTIFVCLLFDFGA